MEYPDIGLLDEPDHKHLAADGTWQQCRHPQLCAGEVADLADEEQP
jgi:hypothetical protein